METRPKLIVPEPIERAGHGALLRRSGKRTAAGVCQTRVAEARAVTLLAMRARRCRRASRPRGRAPAAARLDPTRAAVHAADAGRPGADGPRMALRDQVGRRPRAGRSAPARRVRPALAHADRRDRALPGGRGRDRAAARRRPRARRARSSRSTTHGRPSFQRLQRRMHVDARPPRRRPPRVPAHRLRLRLPRPRTAATCARCRSPARKALVLGGRRRGRTRSATATTSRRDGPGVLRRRVRRRASRASSPSAPTRPTVGGRRREWLKVKCHRRQEFVIGGWTDPKGTREPPRRAPPRRLRRRRARLRRPRRLRPRRRARSATSHARLAALADERCPFTRGTSAAWARSTTGCGRSSSARCASASGPPTAASATRCSSGLRADQPAREVRRETPEPRALRLDRDRPDARAGGDADDVVAGGLGGAREVARALRVVDQEIDLLAARAASRDGPSPCAQLSGQRTPRRSRLRARTRRDRCQARIAARGADGASPAHASPDLRFARPPRAPRCVPAPERRPRDDHDTSSQGPTSRSSTARRRSSGVGPQAGEPGVFLQHRRDALRRPSRTSELAPSSVTAAYRQPRRTGRARRRASSRPDAAARARLRRRPARALACRLSGCAADRRRGRDR